MPPYPGTTRRVMPIRRPTLPARPKGPPVPGASYGMPVQPPSVIPPATPPAPGASTGTGAYGSLWNETNPYTQPTPYTPIAPGSEGWNSAQAQAQGQFAPQEEAAQSAYQRQLSDFQRAYEQQRADIASAILKRKQEAEKDAQRRGTWYTGGLTTRYENADRDEMEQGGRLSQESLRQQGLAGEEYQGALRGLAAQKGSRLSEIVNQLNTEGQGRYQTEMDRWGQGEEQLRQRRFQWEMDAAQRAFDASQKKLDRKWEEHMARLIYGLDIRKLNHQQKQELARMKYQYQLAKGASGGGSGGGGGGGGSSRSSSAAGGGGGSRNTKKKPRSKNVTVSVGP